MRFSIHDPMELSLQYLFLSFALYSFCGWLYESTVCSLWEYGRFVNRGSLLGPYCPVYGGGCILSVILHYYIPHPAALFLVSACGCIAVEYLAGSILENIFHKKLWDYTGMAFQYKGRICLLGFLFFGISATVIGSVIQPMVNAVLDTIHPNVRVTAFWVLCVLMIGDTLLSSVAYLRVSRRLYRFCIRWHAIVNREMRSISDTLERRCPDRILAYLSGMQTTILDKNHDLCQMEQQRREEVSELIDRFRKP